VIINADGSRLTPSVVGYAKTGKRLVGALAKRQSVLNPENTIYSAKRFIGRRYSEAAQEIHNVPYRVAAGANDAAGPAASDGGGGEGRDRAVQPDRDDRFPAVHLRRRWRPQTPGGQVDQGEVRPTNG